MREQSLHLETISKRDVDDGPDRGGTISVYGLTRHDLEELTTKTVSTEWGNLDALSANEGCVTEHTREK
jgi:hypothetical protein